MVSGFSGGRTGCRGRVDAPKQHTDASLTVQQDQRLAGSGRADNGGVDQEDDQAFEVQDRSQVKTIK